MAAPPQKTNPFYVLLVLVGITFSVTACSYLVLMLRDSEGVRTAPTGLLGFLDRHGLVVMGTEIAILAFATLAAILSEPYWNPEPEKTKCSETK